MFKKDNFSKWLESGLKTMEDENAYCLNLFDEDDEWTCELVATDQFYQDGKDWCFDETKVYKREKPFVLISKYSQGNYEKILNNFSQILQDIVCNNENIKNTVINKTFAYGFVDGELYFVDTCEKELC